MNLNHDPDKHLLDQIDKLVEKHQPSDEPLLNELASTRPTPHPAFQNALEERLLARLEPMQQGETPMVNAYITVPAPRRNWLPLTLLAALIVVAIAGVMLMNGRGKSNKPNEMALVAPTATATPVGSIVPPIMEQNIRIPGVGNVAPVVIAIRDIPQGTVLGSAWLETVYWTDDVGYIQTYTDKEVLRGLIAKQDIPRWQPIIPAYLSDHPVSTLQPTDVPSPLVNVVVAFQNLPRGYTFSDRDLSNAAGYAGWPANTVPTGAIRDNGISNLTTLWGKTLQTDVSRGQPILADDLIDQNVTGTPNAEKVVMIIPRSKFIEVGQNVHEGGTADIVFSFFYLSRPDNSPNTPLKPSSQIVPVATKVNVVKIDGQNNNDEITLSVTRPQSVIIQWALDSKLILSLAQIVFDIPTNLIDSTHDPIQAGDSIDIYSTCLLVANPTAPKVDCTDSVERKDFVGTFVLLNGSLNQNGTSATISLAVPADIQLRLSNMIADGMHFKLVKSAQVIQPTPTPVPLPPGKVAVEIPLASITTIQNSNGIQVGDYVDVIATVLFQDIGDKAPAELQQMITPQPIQPIGKMTQRVVQNALVVSIGDTLTLAVSPDEVKVVQWLLSAHLSMTLRPISKADVPQTTVLPPAYTVNLNLDSVSHWAADDLQVGDKVDVVVGLVLGDGSSLNLGFKPYGTYNWIGAPFNGKNSAQTYIPVTPNSQSGTIFLRRAVQSATVTAIGFMDSESGQGKIIRLTLEITSGTASTQGDFLKDWVSAGMPYLVVKH